MHKIKNIKYTLTCASLNETGNPVSSKYPKPPKLSRPSETTATAYQKILIHLTHIQQLSITNDMYKLRVSELKVIFRTG